jgi:hypothetical protein
MTQTTAATLTIDDAYWSVPSTPTLSVASNDGDRRRRCHHVDFERWQQQRSDVFDSLYIYTFHVRHYIAHRLHHACGTAVEVDNYGENDAQPDTLFIVERFCSQW